MKKIILIMFLLSTALYSQSVPMDYSLSASRVFKTQDASPNSNVIDDIVIVGDTIFLATGNGVSISTDDGESWNNFGDIPEFEGVYGSRLTYKNGVLYVGVWHSEEILGGSEEPFGDGIRITSDLGNTWTSIDQPVDTMADSTIVYGVSTLRALPTTVTGQNFILDIETTSNAIWIAARAGGLRRSFDNGQTWERVVLPPDYLDYIHPDSSYTFQLSGVEGSFVSEGNLNHIPFSILVIDDNNIYVGTAGGINRTTDGGSSWTKFNHTNQNNPISANHVWSMSYDETDGSIWACTWKAEGDTEFNAISTSNDSGANWTTFFQGTKTEDIALRHVYTSPTESSREIISVNRDDGLFRSSDGGYTWTKAPTIYDYVTRIELKTESMFSIELKENAFGADIYIGSNEGLVRMQEGNIPWDGDWRIYFTTGESTEQGTETFAFPNPFSPLQRNVSIKYSLTTDMDVTIRVFDFGMNLTRTLIQNAPRFASSEIIQRWDGRDESGSYVANGVYFYRIDKGSDEPIFGKILVVK
ncbi:MAG: hypothetical protein KKA84_08595 [Bacteroidetes bacterium]|nr:hypothetical protein [Bacteroidota bacterium]